MIKEHSIIYSLFFKLIYSYLHKLSIFFKAKLCNIQEKKFALNCLVGNAKNYIYFTKSNFSTNNQMGLRS